MSGIENYYKHRGYPSSYSHGAPISVEAKRERDGEDDVLPESKRMMLMLTEDGDHTPEWYDRVFNAYKYVYQHLYCLGDGYYREMRITTARELEAAMNSTTIRIRHFSADVTGDFMYLAVFRRLKRLYFEQDQSDVERDDAMVSENSTGETLNTPMIPFTLTGEHLDRTTVTELYIESGYHMLTGISAAFAQSLGKITQLQLSCTVRLEGDSVPINAPLLTDLSIGTNAEVQHRLLSHYTSTLKEGWFTGLPSLHRLVVENTANVLAHVPLIGGSAVQEVEVGYCRMDMNPVGTTTLPETWIKTMTGLTRLSLYHTGMNSLDTTQLRMFPALKKLEIGNYEEDEDLLDSDEKSERNGFCNTFNEMNVQIYGMPQLEHVTFEHAEVGVLTLGKEVDEADDARENPPFTNLKNIRINYAGILKLANAERTKASSFLPVLEEVALVEDDTWETREDEWEREGYADWYESVGVYFPVFLFGAVTLASYEGSLRIETSWEEMETIDLDAYLGNAVLPDNFLTSYYLNLLKQLCKFNFKHFRLTSTSRAPLKEALEAAYVEIRAERRAKQEAKQRAKLEKERAKARAKERAALFEKLVTRMPADVQEHARESFTKREIVPPHRAAPYFTRYDPNVQCKDGRDIPSPFVAASTPTGMRYPTCIICREPFNRAYHDADTEPILDNNFLERRNELELALQQDAIGCVVVCNVLPSDFDANQYAVQKDETPQQAVSRVQCDHHRHFFHRVCYATTLFDMFSINGNTFRCPETRTQFY